MPSRLVITRTPFSHRMLQHFRTECRLRRFLHLRLQGGIDLISDSLPFGRLWYAEPNAISYAKFFSRSRDAVIRVFDDTGNVIETNEQAGDFREW